jgi:DNA-binding MarR family transcriptional regulator
MSSTRMNRYIPLAREFSTRVVLFHEAVAENVGLHVTDVKALLMLAAAPMTPTQLSERLGLTGAAVTALVDRLFAAGFATRDRDEEDRRRVTVRAVPAHVRKIERRYDGYSAEMAKILAGFDAKEFMLLEDYLTRTTRLLTEQAAALRERASKLGGG